MPDLTNAVDNLIAAGFSDDDIKSTLEQIEINTDMLIKQGKSDAEIESNLSQTGILGKDGKRVLIFNKPQQTQQQAQPQQNQTQSVKPQSESLGSKISAPIEAGIQELGKTLLSIYKGLYEPESLKEAALTPLVAGLAASPPAVAGTFAGEASRKTAEQLGASPNVQATIGTAANLLFPGRMVPGIAKRITTPRAKAPNITKDAMQEPIVAQPLTPTAKRVAEEFRHDPNINSRTVTNIGGKRTVETQGQGGLDTFNLDEYNIGGYKKAYEDITSSDLKFEGGTKAPASAAEQIVNESDRILTTAGKGKVGEVSDAIERQLRIEEVIRQSEMGRLALADDLADEVARSVTPEVKLNLNNAQLRYLDNQIDELVDRHSTLSKNVGELKPGSRVPATNMLQNIERDLQVLRDEASLLNAENSLLMPQISENALAETAAKQLELTNLETVNAGLKFQIDPDKPLASGALPTEAVSAIDQEVNRLGQQYLIDSIKPWDIDPPIIGSTWQSGFNPIDEATKINNIASRITLDIGGGVRLKDGTVGKIAGMHSDGRIRVTTNKGDRLATPRELQTEELRYVASEPRIVGTKIESSGKIKFHSDSGLTKKAADEAIDVPTLDVDSAANGKYINSKLIESKANGLDSLEKPLEPPKNAQNRPLTNASQHGGPSGPTPPIQSEFGAISDPVPHIETNVYKWRPTVKVALDFEYKSGIPVFTKLFHPGRKASDNHMTMKLHYGAKVDKIFVDEGLNGYTKAAKASQENVTSLLERINKADAENLTPPQLLNKLRAEGLTGSIREVKVAANLRKLYEEAFEAGAIDPAKYLEYYSPRRTSPDELLFDFVQHRTTDYLPFFKHQRTGNMYPRETNANVLAHRYFDAWSRSTHLNPWYEKFASPLINNVDVIKNATAREYFKNYMFDVMRYPRQSAVETSDRMYTIVNNWVGRFYGDEDLAADIIKRFGEERMGEVLAQKFMDLEYKFFLGYRPISAARNATQRLFALPLMQSGNKWGTAEINLLNGFRKTLTKDGREKIMASGISGSYSELAGGRAGSLFDPMAMYKGVETNSRGSIYLPIHDRVLKAFQDGKSFKDVAHDVNLHYYHPMVRKEFQRLYEGRLVRDVRDGLEDNGAHFLGDMAQVMTQFAYEKGSAPEILRASPTNRVVGTFQSWTLLTADYMGNYAKNVVNTPGYGMKAKELYHFGKMVTYYALLDTLMENTFGISFQSNPVFSIPTDIGGSPPVKFARDATSLIGTTLGKMTLDMMGVRNKTYKFLDQEQGRALRETKFLFTPGVYRDIENASKSKIGRDLIRDLSN